MVNGKIKIKVGGGKKPSELHRWEELTIKELKKKNTRQYVK